LLATHLKDSLSHAVTLRKFPEVKKLVDTGVDINEIDSRGDTALKQALIIRHSEMILYLLDHGANPNILCTAKDLKGKVIQPYLKPYQLLSTISLERHREILLENQAYLRALVLFGTTRDSLIFHDDNPEALKIFTDTEQIHHKKSVLEAQVKINSTDEKRLAYNGLGDIWSTLGEQETHVAFKSFYQRKAVHYRHLSEQLQDSPSERSFEL